MKMVHWILWIIQYGFPLLRTGYTIPVKYIRILFITIQDMEFLIIPLNNHKRSICLIINCTYLIIVVLHGQRFHHLMCVLHILVQHLPRHRSAKIISLNLFTANLIEKNILFFGFHPFCQSLHSDSFGHGDYGTNDISGFLIKI